MTRLEFHKKLCKILGSSNVYFQPPSGQRILYPAIVYARAPYDRISADNIGYIIKDKYLVTHITKDPNSLTPRMILEQLGTRQEQAYQKDGLYHTVFTMID